ncbi:phosphoglucosamine mutase [Candidatus Kaiserbacteria bacterium]|nr:phosphoglucosamine mutase [Candidatus Kaiserbacteria bacterium]
MGKYFGTDGIRGVANEKLKSAFVLRLGHALGTFFQKGERRHRVIIGKDTRLSGYRIEFALASGFAEAGMNVTLLGPMPTAAVAMLTHTMRADVGVMISASHNPYEDNGIKIFDPNGYKLSDEARATIERMLDPSYEIELAESHAVGRVSKDETNRARYVQFVKMTVQGLSLEGLRIVVDCANGAAYKSAPEALSELGAEVIQIGCQPDGFNINRGCGSTSMGALRDKVREMRADVGIAFDGDADRVQFVDEDGKIADGDQLLGVLATRWAQSGCLEHSTVVGTIMSNMGLEMYLKRQGISMVRTPVGDHHILERMRDDGYVLGGEPSGHVIIVAPQFPKFGTIADGLATALQILSVLVAEKSKTSKILHCFEPVSQILRDVGAKDGEKILADSRVKEAKEAVERALEGIGRLVLRSSGTEPVIRIMVECTDKDLASKMVESIADAIRAAKE